MATSTSSRPWAGRPTPGDAAMARAWSTGARAARQAGGRLEVPLAEADVLARAQAARAKMQRLLSSPTPFSGDDGAADPAVTRALDALDAGSQPRHLLLERLWSALAASRVIVPVEAHALPARTRPAGPTGPGGKASTHPVHTADASRDAATLAVELPDGHIALPVFTSVGAMLAWRADVRPVPVEPRRAAVVAYEHTDQLWVLDPGTRDLRLPRPAVVALAGGEDWVPSWRSTLIQDELTAQLSGLEGVTAVAFAPGQASELRILLRVDASAGRGAVADTLAACQEVLVNPAWGELIDTVELVPLPA